MQKAGKILLLVAAIFALSGAIEPTYASTLTDTGLLNVNIGSSTFVSTPKPSATITRNTSATVESKPVETPISTNPTPTNSEPITPTTQATRTPTPARNATQSVAGEPPAASLDANKIFDMINAFRTSQGLPAFEKNDQVQELAQVRSGELIQEAINGTIHSGLYNRNLPYWIWENAKYGSDEAGTVAWWLASSLHRHSILGDYKYSSVACTGNYCSELFTSFIPK